MTSMTRTKMGKTTEDPWGGIAAPSSAGVLSMRRVAEDGRWDFYWARDAELRCLLVLRSNTASMPRTRLPHLRGVEVFIQPAADDGKAGLVVRLLDYTLRDIFLRLCLDIIASSGDAIAEADAVARAVGRTWRWHHLLRGGRGTLGPDEQIGLIGELLILERFLLPKIGAVSAVEAWRGPLGYAQDFASGNVCIESKARGRSRASEVRINSEQQLDYADATQFFLAVTVFEFANASGAPGATVTDVARRVRAIVANASEAALGRFDALLEAAGLGFDDDYSAWPWLESEQFLFHVKADFPRIVPRDLPAGVSKIRYDLSLPSCSEYLVPKESLDHALGGTPDV